MRKMSAPFFIVGPTATGKSEIAAEIAARCGGEIVGADAFQLYEGFALLTAKPSAETLRRIPHHLIDWVPLAEDYNVARYQEAAQQYLEDIARRGKRAMAVGGSGLYVKALTHGLSPLPPAQAGLRAELELLHLPTLLARLQTLDPVAAQAIDAKNKRRLVRALEVCLTTGSRFSDHRSLWSQPPDAAAPAAGVFLTRDRNELHERIERRVEAMFPGALEEVRSAPVESLGPTAAGMIGLAEIRAYLDSKISRQQCLERIKAATRQYAKRQITWFKRERIFTAINLSAVRDSEAVITLILNTMQNHAAHSSAAPQPFPQDE
jgi:tRNA dimethylallyltransferase